MANRFCPPAINLGSGPCAADLRLHHNTRMRELQLDDSIDDTFVLVRGRSGDASVFAGIADSYRAGFA